MRTDSSCYCWHADDQQGCSYALVFTINQLAASPGPAGPTGGGAGVLVLRAVPQLCYEAIHRLQLTVMLSLNSTTRVVGEYAAHELSMGHTCGGRGHVVTPMAESMFGIMCMHAPYSELENAPLCIHAQLLMC